MTIRRKVLLEVGAALVLFLVAVSLTASIAFMRSYLNLERDRLSHRMEIVHNALLKEVESLETLTRDWAFWDDTYEFLETFTERFIRSNLQPSSFREAAIDCAAFLRRDGFPVWAGWYHRESHHIVPAPAEIVETARSLRHVLECDTPTCGATGILVVATQALLLAGCPALTTAAQGPSRGGVFFARVLDDELLARIGETARTHVDLFRCNDAALPPDVRRSQEHFVRFGQPVVLERDANTAWSYVVLPDIYGHPAIILRALFPRYIAYQGRQSLRFLVAIMVLQGILTMLLLIRALDRRVMRRLSQIDASITQNRDRPDFSWRVPAEGDDELAALAHHINAMMEALEQMSETRRQTESLYRTLFSAISSGLAMLERTESPPGGPVGFTVRHVNEYFAALWNLTPEKMIGRPLAEISEVPRPLLTAVSCVADTSEPLQLEQRTPSERLLELRIHPCGPSHVAILAEDITEKRQRELEQIRLERLESLAVLASGIAHDFNNILSAILGNIHLAQTTAKALSPEAKNLLLEAEAACLRARGLTHQLLTFARGGHATRKPCHLGPIITNAAHFVLHGSPSKPNIEIEPGLWPVSADASQIAQVVHNLVLNADQAMPSGGVVTITARNVLASDVPLKGAKQQRYVEIAVKDTGVGIPPEVQQRIFEPYFTTKQRGSGLGLATCLSIVRAHEGFITFESEPGRGTTFRVYLPATDEPPPPPIAEEPAMIPGEGRILVLDDDRAVRAVCVRMLQQAGYSVVETADGRETVQAYVEALEKGQPFDVVLLDLTVAGGWGGLDTLRELRKRDPHVKAVLITGYADTPMTDTALECGFVGVISKPFRLNDLTRVVAEARAASPP